MGSNNKVEAMFGLICSEKGYVNLFRASVYLATFYLVSAFSVLDKALPIELQSVEYKAKVEYKLKQEISFKELQCNIRSETYVDCVKAKHRHGEKNSILHGLEAVHNVTKYLMTITFGLTVIGFIGTPFIKREASTNKTNTISYNVVVKDEKHGVGISYNVVVKDGKYGDSIVHEEISGSSR